QGRQARDRVPQLPTVERAHAVEGQLLQLPVTRAPAQQPRTGAWLDVLEPQCQQRRVLDIDHVLDQPALRELELLTPRHPRHRRLTRRLFFFDALGGESDSQLSVLAGQYVVVQGPFESMGPFYP